MNSPVTVENENPAEYLEIRAFEFKGKNFRLAREIEHGHWMIQHMSNRKPVKGCEGLYTTLDAALRAIYQLPDEIFEAVTRKVVLTPKVKDA